MLTSAFPRTTEVVRTFAQTQTAHLLVSVRPDSFLKRTTGRAKVFLFLLLFYGARLFSTWVGVLYWSKRRRSLTDIDECATDNGGCSDRCVNVPSSYQCSCPEGYTLMDDWMTCRDVDECLIAEENSPSIQLCGSVGTCLNTAGSYRCICPPGYEDRDNTCIGPSSHFNHSEPLNWIAILLFFSFF